MALIIAVGLFTYANSFHGLFVLDEKTAIIDNPNIRSLGTAFSAPPQVGLGGRPVVSLSFALNYALAPAAGREAFTPPPPGYPPEAWQLLYRNLWGYHAANLAIHVLAALVLFGIVRRTLSGERLRLTFGAAAMPLALVVSLLWVAHPLNTGSVTYVAQRVESLMGLFYLLTLYCAIRAGEHVLAEGLAAQAVRRKRLAVPEASVRRAGWMGAWWSVAAVAACTLGVGTKEVMVSAPIVVALYDMIFLSAKAGGARPLWRRRWPLYAGLAGTWILLAGLVASASRSASVGFYLHGWSPWLYLQTQAGVIVHYLRLVFVPWPLSLDYDWPAARSFVEVLPQAALLATLFVLTVWGLVRLKPMAFPGAWFFLTLAPSSSVLPIVTEIAAEHRMYLPLGAVIAVVVLGAYGAARRAAAGSTGPGFNALGAAGVAIAAMAIVGCVHLARQRNLDYHSDERIWSVTVAARPQNSRALANLGVVLVEQGRAAEAEPYLRRAIGIRPDYPEAQSGLGAALCTQGKLEEGVAHLERAIALEPGYRDAYRNLGEALGALGRLGPAARAFREALRTAPDDAVLLKRLAWILATASEDDVRNGAEALRIASRAVEVTGGDAAALDTLAAAQAETGQFADAVATVQRAIAAAEAAGPAELVPELRQRLALYRAGQKFRDLPQAR